MKVIPPCSHACSAGCSIVDCTANSLTLRMLSPVTTPMTAAPPRKVAATSVAYGAARSSRHATDAWCAVSRTTTAVHAITMATFME